MKIPHTKKVDTTGINIHSIESELFSFCIEDYGEEDYLRSFIEKINCYLPSFVFSKKTLEIKEEQYREGRTTASPLDQARELLQKTSIENITSNGEFGEFLLYLFAKEVKGAKKIVSKIQMRGSDRVPIHGRDGVFMLIDENDNVYLLTGESKIKDDSNDGLREAQGDLNNFWASGNINHEILLASNSLVDEIDSNNFLKYEQYFLQGNPLNDDLKYKNIIFIGYGSEDFKKLVSSEISIYDFEQRIKEDIGRCFRNQEDLIRTGNKAAIYCFVPFETALEARKQFAQSNGLITN